MTYYTLFTRSEMKSTGRKCIFFLVLVIFASCSKDNTIPLVPKAIPEEVIDRPNIVVILTDQERYPTHWPKGWAEKNLSSCERLKKHGLTFLRAYTAACECTPSRAVLTTSEYSPVTGINRTPTLIGLPSSKELVDIGSLLKNYTDYEVVWKGKWHLSPPLKGGHDWTENDIAAVQNKYDIFSWNPPDAGTAITEFSKNPNGTVFDGLTTLGGGYANNDNRFVQGQSLDDPKEIPGFGESALDYIKKIGDTDPAKRKPFCLFISLVNPHDVWVYPNSWEAAGYKKENFADVGIDLPTNYTDDLVTKPSVQLKARVAYNAQAPLKDLTAEKEYVNFYAYLHTVVDSHIGKILDALETAGLTDDTIIIRTADHGELGLSHGMREKAYTAYEEMIHIPFIISNPKLFPAPQTTDAFYCHLDLLPTIADLTQVPNYSKFGKGVSMVPVIKNPNTSVQDSVLFAYDDIFFLPTTVPGGHIRAIREGDWTYAVYYSEDGSNFEYELYNLKKDPGQRDNLLYQNTDSQITAEAKRLHQLLKDKTDRSNALPKGFPLGPP